MIIKNYDKQHLELARGHNNLQKKFFELYGIKIQNSKDYDDYDDIDVTILTTNTTLSAKINEVKSEILLKRITKYY